MRKVILALILLAAAPSAAQAKTACQRLQGRDLAGSAQGKLVSTKSGRKTRVLRGCALPGGPVRTFATASGNTEQFRSLQSRGRFALVQTTTLSAGDNVEKTSVIDLRSGASYDAALATIPSEISMATVSSNTVINRRGNALALLQNVQDDTQRLVVYSATGEPTVLEEVTLPSDVPADSLHITATTAGWTSKGEAKSAPLP